MIEQILLFTVVTIIAIALGWRWVSSRTSEAKLKFKGLEASIRHED